MLHPLNFHDLHSITSKWNIAEMRYDKIRSQTVDEYFKLVKANSGYTFFAKDDTLSIKKRNDQGMEEICKKL